MATDESNDEGDAGGAPSILEASRARLDALEAAMARLDEGRYGRCLDCDASIDDEVLRRDPTAGYCHGVSCASADAQRPAPA